MTQKCSYIFAWYLVSVAALAPGQAIPTITGSLQALVGELTSSDYFLHHPHRDPRPYIEPTMEVSTLYRASRHISGGELHEAARLARQVDCEVVRFVDEQTKDDYVLLREDVQALAHPAVGCLPV